MRNDPGNAPLRWALIVVASILYWTGVARWSGVGEPWDASGFWRLWYPASILLAAAAGPLVARHGWCAGLVVTLAQLPVMAATMGGGTMWLLGLGLCVVLSIPPIAASAVTASVVARARGA